MNSKKRIFEILRQVSLPCPIKCGFSATAREKRNSLKTKKIVFLDNSACNLS